MDNMAWNYSLEDKHKCTYLERTGCCCINTVVMVYMTETPLIHAAHNGRLQMVQFLIEQGADVDCIALVQDSPLYILQLIDTCLER